jgi:uncharacterized cupin superfamily protein
MTHIINISELEFKPSPVPMPDSVKEKYEGATVGQAGMLLGSRKIGYNVTVVPAGKRAFPFHNHHINEEMFFVLEGEGEVRIGEEKLPIKKGDFICCPPGGYELAHQIINTSQSELRYLAVSSKQSPEVVDYPDSGKFGVADEGFRYLGKVDQSLGYWDGE